MLPRPENLTYLGINLSFTKWFLSLYLILSARRRQFLFLFLVASIFLWHLSTANLQGWDEKPEISRAPPATVIPDCFSFPCIPVPRSIHQASLSSLVPGTQLFKSETRNHSYHLSSSSLIPLILNSQTLSILPSKKLRSTHSCPSSATAAFSKLPSLLAWWMTTNWSI